jgi:hypothetical protein
MRITMHMWQVLGVTAALAALTAVAAAAQPAPTGVTDRVTTFGGGSLGGKVVGIEPGGSLRLTGPQFASDVLVRTSALQVVTLAAGQRDTAADQVGLVGGDRLGGTLVAITPETVEIDTQAAGRLKIPRSRVASIRFGATEEVLVESAFADGEIAPWVIGVPEAWAVEGGALVCKGSFAERQPVYVKVNQAEPITVVAKIQALQGENFRFDFAIGSDRLETTGRSGLIVVFMNGRVRMLELVGGSSYPLGDRPLPGGAFTAGVLRVGFQPVTRQCHVWIDETDLGEYALPAPLPQGQYVMFGSNVPLRVEYVRVLRDIVPPVGADDGSAGPPADQGMGVHLANGDMVAATQIALADGRVTLASPYGEIKCDAKSVTRVVFGRKAAKPPARKQTDVQVRTKVCRLTLQIDRMTADALIGRSDAVGGEVKLRRANILELQFGGDD